MILYGWLWLQIWNACAKDTMLQMVYFQKHYGAKVLICTMMYSKIHHGMLWSRDVGYRFFEAHLGKIWKFFELGKKKRYLFNFFLHCSSDSQKTNILLQCENAFLCLIFFFVFLLFIYGKKENKMGKIKPLINNRIAMNDLHSIRFYKMKAKVCFAWTDIYRYYFPIWWWHYRF